MFDHRWIFLKSIFVTHLHQGSNMELITKKPLALAIGITMSLALPSLTSANGVPDFVTTDSSNSANAMFIIEQNGVALEVMTDFGYFKSSTVGTIAPLPIPVDAGGDVIAEPTLDSPFFPGNSEHAYLILNVMELMPAILPPEPLPVPGPRPIIDPLPPIDPPGAGVIVGPPPFVDVDPTLPPIDLPPFPGEPVYEVLYFELTVDQIMITDQSTSIEVDTCQQLQPSVFFGPCGIISVNWTNSGVESSKSRTTSLTKTSNGFLGQPMTIKGTSRQFYSSASATLNAAGQTISNDFAGRSASKSKQAFHLDNEIIILN